MMKRNRHLRWLGCISIIGFGMGVSAASPAHATPLRAGQWVKALDATRIEGGRALPEGGVIGYLDAGDWISFGPFRFMDGFVDRMEIQFAAPQTQGRITVHLDRPDGPKVAEFLIVDTGGYQHVAPQLTDCEQLSGTHGLVFVFHQGSNLGNLKAFRVLTPQQQASPNALRYGQVQKELERTVIARIEEVLALNQADILKHRTRVITLQGRPGAPVRVSQKRHAFPFGTAFNWRGFFENSDLSAEQRAKYLEVLEANFNSVVHENELKWYHNEGEKDRITFEHADRMTEWALERGMEVRGHCVFWGRDEIVQGWQKELDDEELLRRLQERAELTMTRHRGRIREWDMNNEMLHCHYYSNRFGWDIHNQMFHWCHQHDPDALLFVNDYSVISGGMTDAYVQQIRKFLDDGAPVGGIGVQGHFGSRVDGQDVKAKLDKLARFGLPIRVTEFDANTSSEPAKALALATLYATAFAHPSVTGITMWGFWEGAHWRPDAALWDLDWTINLAGRTYRELVFNRWWTQWQGTIGPDGTVQVRVFYGDHEVEIDGRKETLSVRCLTND